jgi:hypothetical protein
MLRRTLLAVISLVLLAGCSDVDVGGSGSAELGGGIDATPLPSDRVDDPDCDPAVIGGDDGSLVAAYAVQEAQVVGVCAGDPDRALDAAWRELTAAVPAEQLRALTVFAGYDDPDSDVAAFATLLGESNDRFGIVVNLALAEEDPEELRLTLVHEVAHVFTQTPDQLDVDADPAECATFHNGNGCFVDGSLMAEWIDWFWSDDQLAALPDPSSADAADDAEGDDPAAARRCSLDPGFLGTYAASSPEEDFAESFSAFVFDLDVPSEVQPRLDFFAQHPQLAAVREHALADGREPPVNNFDECGV